MRYRVISDWSASYDQPIELAAGEGLELSGRKDCWDGHLWLWARSFATGREGWIPDSLPLCRAGKLVSGCDYSARELTCRTGQILASLGETHGWVLCEAEVGDIGWVPRACLAPIPDAGREDG
ncbi:SH3 domain-containing protein [Paracoccus alkanivorans]|uniref:SH3 domain-containing protein n=1 Tax=Paracoccus alkanivorans TaxID=2116655 RepID=A0A3M0MJJ5_9RHOB|nr:SH3 domain-containing protein [Paracoccus alkanivorans]RMC37625.1 hypothetical protein C9E81_02450 [Paracoccus alkanivorans]